MVCLFAFSLTTGTIASNWPSKFLVSVTGISSLLAIIICGRIIPSSVGDRVDRSIFVCSCTVGGILNMVVKIVNDGYMPVLGLTGTEKHWVPMNGAKLVWLGDWLVGDYSIGDLLVIAGVFWIIYCLVKWRVRSAKRSRLLEYRTDG